jgi:hypothetical protein
LKEIEEVVKVMSGPGKSSKSMAKMKETAGLNRA